jgi:hypothetical protein
MGPSFPFSCPTLIDDIARLVTVLTVHPQLSYQVPDNFFSRVFDRVSRMTADKWEIDPKWDLGGCTLGPAPNSRIILDTLRMIHGEISRHLGNPATILRAIIKYHPRTIWQRISMRPSQLPQSVVAATLSDLPFQLDTSDAQHKDIRTLWKVGEELSYLPKQENTLKLLRPQ